ncbi:protein LEO1 homolog [Vicia villosa]|uniref:protein LEO1 homolog n=1 Tax=Vicia villosa TaxID=3911 RepID=UPI00273C6B05|nr:protein LEO1 homolog [Vicia villosa]
MKFLTCQSRMPSMINHIFSLDMERESCNHKEGYYAIFLVLKFSSVVDSRQRKVYKVKNCVTDIDPEREKEEKEKAESQTIRASQLLSRKRDKVNKKYTPTDRRRQLSPGFLEDALDT